jgi:hypothetical protein
MGGDDATKPPAPEADEGEVRLPFVLCPALLALCSCRLDPEAPVPPDLPSPAAAPAPEVVAFPPLAGGVSAPVVQFLVRPAEGQRLEASSAAVVRGEVSDSALRSLRESTLPATLAARLVPARALVTGEGALVLAPTEPLEGGQSYTLAVGSLGLRLVFSAHEDGLPRLRRLWPTDPVAGPGGVAVYCGEGALPSPLDPLGARLGGALALRRGALDDPDEERCLTLQAPADGPWVLPVAAVHEGAVVAYLSPALLGAASPAAPAATPLGCSPAQIALGPGCLDVQDDRAMLSLPPSSWLLLRPGFSPVAGPGPLVIGGLVPDSFGRIGGTLLDLGGNRWEVDVAVVTGAPEPHIVINEVLADPVGPEQASEWVEIYNDGVTEVDLSGWLFGDSAGSATLPAATLRPGDFALLTGPAFDSSADVTPPAAVLRIPLPHLGKTTLSNQGAELRLRDLTGRTVSRFPPSPKPARGCSVLRRTPRTPDDAPDGFLLSRPGQSTPGAPNPGEG